MSYLGAFVPPCCGYDIIPTENPAVRQTGNTRIESSSLHVAETSQGIASNVPVAVARRPDRYQAYARMTEARIGLSIVTKTMAAGYPECEALTAHPLALFSKRCDGGA
jgi:hypothetical protein